MAASSSHWAVHQLWPPPEGNQRTELDVVLFHGLQLTANDSSDAWRSTWTQRGRDDVCWPQEWLPFDLREAVRIFSVSYNAHVVTSPYDVSEIVHNLFQTLIDPRFEWHHPIVLIGHSFGGLVLESLVVKLKRESTVRNPTNSWSKATVQCAKMFLRNVRGVAFYAVPHAGASNIAEYVNTLLGCNERHHSGIMANIRPRQRDMEELSVDFDDIVNENKIDIYAFSEGRPMEQVGILVNFSSAQRLARSNSYKVEDANHIEVCKPPSKEHSSYSLLLQFIITCGKVARECDQPLQEVHDLPQSLFGLQSYVKIIETLVTLEGSDAAPRYLGVWGVGGVGKTLLLQILHGSRKVQGHFRGAEFIWLTVGRTSDIMALYGTLSEELGLKPELNANPEVYKLKLHSQFKQQRVFLVLEDVWQDEAFYSLDLAKGKGSVTLFTTRNQSLLKRAKPPISQVHMTPLSKESYLFCVHAFRPPSNVPCELKALAQCMPEECQGVPLALKVQRLDPAMSGAPSSSSTNTNGPYTQIVHPVHELNPRCTELMDHIMTIIFFHGISFGTNDDWKEAWTSYPTDTRHESVCWPEQWLPEDLGDNVRILSLSYDANVFGAHDHVTEIGKNLIQSLVTSYGNLWVAPIVLVGYSFGGLVVKSLMVEVHRRIHQNSTNALERKVNESCKNFSKYLKGIVFYAVPHSGVSKEFLNYIVSKCQEKNVLFEKLKAQSSLLNDLESFNRQMHELSVDFQTYISTDLITFGFAEGKPLDENSGVLVPYASACGLTGNNNYKIEDANHLTICKPPAKDHQGYLRLLDVLNTCLEVPGNSTSNGHVVLLAKFKSTMLTNLMPSTFGDTHRSIAIGFKNYTTYNFQNTWVYFQHGTSDLNMPFQIGPEHVGIWGVCTSSGDHCGSSGTFSYYIKEKNKTLYVMWSVPLNTIAYENLWSATVVDGRQEANNHTHNAMYNGRSGMPRPWTSGGWKHRNINRFRLNGWMSTNRQATLELEVKSL